MVVVVVVELIGVARDFVVGDCRVGRGMADGKMMFRVSQYGRTNSRCALVDRANGKADCRCSLQFYSGEETRLLGRQAGQPDGMQ